MLVYGDPTCELELHSSLRAIREALECQSDSPDALRAALIEAGQLEQAIADAAVDCQIRSSALRTAIALTDAAARAFVSHRQTGKSADEVRGCIELAARALTELPNAQLRAKVPEGFAFYALYPEQYVDAATQWLDKQPCERHGAVLVVGVRSIGTSLSAVVAEVLARGGCDVRRMTVRPTGHPFDRQVALKAGDARGVRRAIVVDEGPGLSGSSMAACADALVGCGIARRAISFFPGHDRMPGPAASAQVRVWWETIPRYVVPLEALRWDGRSLAQLLTRSSERICEQPVIRTEDLGAGKWREIVYAEESQWPVVGAAFERMKFRVVLQDGSCVFWKFAGFHGNEEACRQTFVAQKGFTAGPVGRTLGFVGMPWIEGERLSHDDLDAAMIDRIAAYICTAARPPLGPAQRLAAFDRLREMVPVNVGEALGDSAGKRAGGIANAAAADIEAAELPAYGDGRLAPHEWIRARDGRVLKSDCGGHGADHTLIGPQPVLWDIAGAIVEWGMGRSDRNLLLQGVELVVPDDILNFYELAYAAFRAGFCSLCARTTDICLSERDRLTRAAEKYLSIVRETLH